MNSILLKQEGLGTNFNNSLCDWYVGIPNKLIEAFFPIEEFKRRNINSIGEENETMVNCDKRGFLCISPGCFWDPEKFEYVDKTGYYTVSVTPFSIDGKNNGEIKLSFLNKRLMSVSGVISSRANDPAAINKGETSCYTVSFVGGKLRFRFYPSDEVTRISKAKGNDCAVLFGDFDGLVGEEPDLLPNKENEIEISTVGLMAEDIYDMLAVASNDVNFTELFQYVNGFIDKKGIKRIRREG